MATPSWFSKKNVAQSAPSSQTAKNTAPAPEAAPVVPVQIQPVVPATPLEKVRVAILLPLTGPNAELGHAMLNAAQQAVFDSAATNFELMPRDTGSSEATANHAASDAIASGAKLLIGPLFGAQVPTVAKIASPAGVPILTLSTDTSLTAPGLFVMGLSPAGQAERIARYALAHGLRRLAALVPDNSYGTLVGQAFQLEVARDGGTMVALASFDLAKHNSELAVKELADKSGVIDALFLPEGGNDLQFITKQLSGAGFDPAKIRMLGTGLWDTPETARDAPFVIGGWYAASDPAVRQAFVTAYKTTYQQEPPRLATLAYDATALAAVLAKRGTHFDEASLTNPNGFAGLDGIFRLKASGEVERGLAVLEVTPTGSNVIDPAPPSFALLQ